MTLRDYVINDIINKLPRYKGEKVTKNELVYRLYADLSIRNTQAIKLLEPYIIDAYYFINACIPDAPSFFDSPSVLYSKLIKAYALTLFFALNLPDIFIVDTKLITKLENLLDNA